MPAAELPPTSATLLRLLALPGADGAWAVFIGRYTPFVDARCRAAGLQSADADDVRSEVFGRLVDTLREFKYDPGRLFRGYFAQVVNNHIRTHWRKLARRPGWVGTGGPYADDLPDPLARLGDELDEEIHGEVARLLAAVKEVRAEVGEDAWEAFWLTAVDGLKGDEAAARLGKTPAAIYTAKSRVLARLRAVGGAAGPPPEEFSSTPPIMNSMPSSAAASPRTTPTGYPPTSTPAPTARTGLSG